MKSITVFLVCLIIVGVTALDSALVAQEVGDTTTLVPSSLPIYVNGQRLDPTNEGHRVALNREKGLIVDGVLYLPVVKNAPFKEPTIANGMHFALHRAMVAANATLAAGASRDEAKQSMVDSWRNEFGSELTWVENPADRYQLTMSLRGQSLIVTVPCTADYHPEKVPVDNFDGLVAKHRELVTILQYGSMVICGNGYAQEIKSTDATLVIEELTLLSKQPRQLTMVGEQTVFSSVELMDGKYKLSTSMVKDLLARK